MQESGLQERDPVARGQVGATRACGKALEPPPPPPGEVDACYREGSTQIFEADAAVAPTCKTQKEALPATCDSAADVPAWCAHRPAALCRPGLSLWPVVAGR
jgi:hypothetical protein